MQNLDQFLVRQKDASSAEFFSLSELQSLLNFQYLSHLTFKPEEKILEKGLKQLQDKAVLADHLQLGKRFRREITTGFLPKVSVRWCSDAVGWGLFAEEDLEEDTFVGEYVGHVRKNDDHTSICNYLYAYPVPDPIGRNYVIDATSGNLIRFVNHSYFPNLKPLYAFVDGLYHVILTTLYPVRKGAQLTYDYGRNYWYVRSPPLDV